MEREAMDLELQLLWTEPSNEKHLDQCIGAFDHCNQLMENQFNSLNVKDDGAGDEEISDSDDLDIEDYMEQSMLGCFFPNTSFGHGKRGSRRTSGSAQVVQFSPNFGLQEASTSGGRKHHGGRKNNDHWTQDEVRLLVNGVSEYGVGKWKDVNKKYFLTSIRTPVHLKDKWKNLVKACKKENGRMLVPLEESLIERIMEIDDDNPYPKQSNNRVPDRVAPPPPSPDLLSLLPPPARWSVVKARSTKRASVHKSKNNNEGTSVFFGTNKYYM